MCVKSTDNTHNWPNWRSITLSKEQNITKMCDQTAGTSLNQRCIFTVALSISYVFSCSSIQTFFLYFNKQIIKSPHLKSPWKFQAIIYRQKGHGILICSLLKQTLAEPLFWRAQCNDNNPLEVFEEVPPLVFSLQTQGPQSLLVLQYPLPFSLTPKDNLIVHNLIF